MNSTARNVLFWAVILLALLFLWRMANTGMGPRELEHSFTEFMNRVEAGDVARVEVRGT